MVVALTVAFGLSPSAPAGAAWSRPKPIEETFPSIVPNGVELAVSGEAIHAAWRGQGGSLSSGNDLRYARSLDCGDTWSEPTTLGTLRYQSNLSIAAHGDHVSLVWFRRRGVRPPLLYYSASRDAGATWSVPRRLSRLNRNAGHASVGVFGEEVYVAFVQGNREFRSGAIRRPRLVVAASTDGGQSWVRRRVTGRRIGPPVPRIVLGQGVGSSGLRVHLVYNSGTGDGALQYQVSDTGGTRWSEPVEISDPVRGSSHAKGCATLGADAHVVWTRSDAGFLESVYNGSVDGVFRPMSRVLSGVLGPESESASSSLAAARGTLHAVWSEYRLSDRAIYTSRSPDRGRTWSEPKRLARSVPGLLGDPTIAASDAVTGRCSGSSHVFYRNHSEYVYRRRPRNLD